MPWLWLFTAVLVLILGPSWSRPAGAAECGAWNTGEFFKTATPVRVRACLAAGADLKARDKDGWTPLHLAALTETPAVITTLVAAGADLTTRDENGLTPLHLAAGFTKTPAGLTTLVAAGADLTARDANGLTPLRLIPTRRTSMCMSSSRRPGMTAASSGSARRRSKRCGSCSRRRPTSRELSSTPRPERRGAWTHSSSHSARSKGCCDVGPPLRRGPKPRGMPSTAGRPERAGPIAGQIPA